MTEYMYLVQLPLQQQYCVFFTAITFSGQLGSAETGYKDNTDILPL